MTSTSSNISRTVAPAVFEKNEHGHVVFTITGLDLSGAAEVTGLTEDAYRVSNYAKSCLMSTNPDSYDAHHHLEPGKTYKVVLMPPAVIERDGERTTANLQSKAQSFAYGKPLAGIVPRIREAVSDNQMKELGIDYIAALHDPIKDSDGDPDVLCAYRGDGGRGLNAFWAYPADPWGTRGAFAFLVPAN